MMGGVDDDDDEIATDLVDVGDLTLADIAALDDSVIARSLRRILTESDNPLDAVAGFQSAT